MVDGLAPLWVPSTMYGGRVHGGQGGSAQDCCQARWLPVKVVFLESCWCPLGMLRSMCHAHCMVAGFTEAKDELLWAAVRCAGCSSSWLFALLRSQRL